VAPGLPGNQSDQSSPALFVCCLWTIVEFPISPQFPSGHVH
jgi:hypothetical protein